MSFEIYVTKTLAALFVEFVTKRNNRQSYERHGLEFDCNQEAMLVIGAKPVIDFN